MRKLAAAFAIAALFALPTSMVQAEEEGPSARCNGHMCPMARESTTCGYQSVGEINFVVIDEDEFLS